MINIDSFALYTRDTLERRRKGQNMISRLISALAAAMCLAGLVGPAFADSEDDYTLHRKKGGYSYDKSDSTNTYGTQKKSKSTPPGPPDFRDQTPSGPFDNSFFFDSGVGSIYGGNSTYMH
jgi:hypothetical protein